MGLCSNAWAYGIRVGVAKPWTSLAPAERFSRLARPSSYGRSVRAACARTFANPPTADGMRLLDPIAGPDKLDSVPCGHRDA